MNGSFFFTETDNGPFRHPDAAQTIEKTVIIVTVLKNRIGHLELEKISQVETLKNSIF